MELVIILTWNDINVLSPTTITEFGSYISSQVLANSLERVEKLDNFEALDFDDYMVNIKVERV